MFYTKNAVLRDVTKNIWKFPYIFNVKIGVSLFSRMSLFILEATCLPYRKSIYEINFILLAFTEV